MISNLKSYFNNRLSLVKLEIIEGVGKGVSKMIVGLVMILFLFFTYSLLMMGLSFLLAELFFDNKFSIGFLLTAAFNLLFFIVVLIFRKNIIEKSLLDIFISAAFKSQNELEDPYYEDTESI